MRKPRPITERESNLIQLYAYCTFGMTPQGFYGKWDVRHEEIALIAFRSKATVSRWFGRGGSRRYPTLNDLRNIALADFLLEHFEEIPEELRDLLCYGNQHQ